MRDFLVMMKRHFSLFKDVIFLSNDHGTFLSNHHETFLSNDQETFSNDDQETFLTI